MKKILLIEDEKQIRSALSQLFEREGYEVHVAADADAGIELFREGQPDVVITDILMPKKTGFHVVKAIKRDAPKVPIIVITGGGGKFDPEQIAKVATGFGVTSYLTKPFTNKEILEKVLEVLK